ncbi:hypothetical protein DH2020_037295 [Rehmannia glutinosa]|uniref:Uncharacterized protein n=1 Tax=Rehmannia glutinosa TaxID=99300 RepID=A0ABR0V4C6_REHGL
MISPEYTVKKGYWMRLKDPKDEGRYVKRWANFMVTDDLTVIYFFMSSIISILNALKSSLSDVKELELDALNMKIRKHVHGVPTKLSKPKGEHETNLSGCISKDGLLAARRTLPLRLVCYISQLFFAMALFLCRALQRQGRGAEATVEHFPARSFISMQRRIEDRHHELSHNKTRLFRYLLLGSFFQNLSSEKEDITRPLENVVMKDTSILSTKRHA